jgi:outer membrane protein assembly factor BamD
MNLHMKLVSLFIALALLTTGCSTRRDFILPGEGPEVLYQLGQDALSDNAYADAITYFRALQGRFPFSVAAKQSQLDTIYIYFKSGDRVLAINAAENFESENPTHPRVDYSIYLKGLSYFDLTPGWLEARFKADLNARPPKDTLLSYSTFNDLLRRFPESMYAADSRNRMIFLRNRLALYEKTIADYYFSRGAYLGAINRANYLLERYPGAPVTQDALFLIRDSYQALGLNEQADNIVRIISANTF